MDVYLCVGAWDDPKSKIVQWITSSSYSHAWMEYDSPTWQGRMVVHSDSKGVVIESLSSFYERRGMCSSRAVYKVLSGDTSKGFFFSKNYLGKSYGYLTLFRNASLLLLFKLGMKFLKPVSDVGKYTCAEFVTLFLQNSGLAEELNGEHTWPGLLEEYLNDNPELYKRVYRKVSN
jgi:hypothetical protein